MDSLRHRTFYGQLVIVKLLRVHFLPADGDRPAG
jgi:hypothetical protein